MNVTLGMTGHAENLVEREDTAREVGSGALLVYATPCLAALMEAATCEAVAAGLEEEETTVGTELNLRHTAATPVGMEVRAEAVVTAVEGRVLTFEIHAFDEAGEIGSATHKRVCVNSQRFLDKAYAKL